MKKKCFYPVFFDFFTTDTLKLQYRDSKMGSQKRNGEGETNTTKCSREPIKKGGCTAIVPDLAQVYDFQRITE